MELHTPTKRLKWFWNSDIEKFIWGDFLWKSPWLFFTLQAGIKKWGTDEETFIEIFTTRSFAQLRAMLPEYKEVFLCFVPFAFVVFNSDYFEKEVKPMGSLCFHKVTSLNFCFLWRKRKGTKKSNIQSLKRWKGKNTFLTELIALRYWFCISVG